MKDCTGELCYPLQQLQAVDLTLRANEGRLSLSPRRGTKTKKCTYYNFNCFTVVTTVIFFPLYISTVSAPLFSKIFRSRLTTILRLFRSQQKSELVCVCPLPPCLKNEFEC